jgi:hypothetical protein
MSHSMRKEGGNNHLQQIFYRTIFILLLCGCQLPDIFGGVVANTVDSQGLSTFEGDSKSITQGYISESEQVLLRIGATSSITIEHVGIVKNLQQDIAGINIIITENGNTRQEYVSLSGPKKRIPFGSGWIELHVAPRTNATADLFIKYDSFPDIHTAIFS